MHMVYIVVSKIYSYSSTEEITCQVYIKVNMYFSSTENISLNIPNNYSSK